MGTGSAPRLKHLTRNSTRQLFEKLRRIQHTKLNTKQFAKSCKKSPWGFQKAPRSSLKAPTGSQKAPKGSQKAPKGSPKAPQGRPREPKGVPKVPQGGPRGSPRGLKGLPWAPQGALFGEVLEPTFEVLFRNTLKIQIFLKNEPPEGEKCNKH